MQRFRRPVLPLVLGYLAGILSGSLLRAGYVFALLAIAASGAITLRQTIRREAALLAPLVLMAALGFLAILPWVAPRYPDHHVIHHISPDAVFLSGEVDSSPQRQADRTRFILDARSLRRGETVVAVTGRVRVTVAGGAPDLHRGDWVELHGRMRALQNFRNPGGFDYRRHMAYQRVWTSLYAPEKRLRILARAKNAPLSAGMEGVRRAAAQMIASHSETPETGVLRALLVGERTGIPARLQESFNRAGVSHILAISGLHVGIVAAAAFTVFQLLLRQIPAVLRRAWSRKGAAVLTLVPVLGYGIIAGMSPATQRAVAMTAVFLAAFWVARDLDTITSMAVAGGIILTLHPPALFAVSFQLSFAAVGAIVFGLHRLGRERRRAQPRNALGRLLLKLGGGVKGMIVMSLLAVWGTLPVVMATFNRVSLIGVAANLVVIPVIGFCVVPLGLAAIACWPLCETAGAGMMRLAAWLLSLVIPVIELLAKQPLAAVTTWTPSAVEIFCYYLVTASAFILATRDGTAPAAAGSRRDAEECRPTHLTAEDGLIPISVRLLRSVRAAATPARLLGLSLALGVLLAAADTLYWMNQRFWHRDLRITVLDVGQGNAALAEFPGGGTMLIDGGGVADLSAFDLGANVLAPFLWRRKILSLDELVLSHPNSDHMHGLIPIADMFNVQALLTNGEPRRTAGYRLLMETAAARGVRLPDFRSAPRERAFGGVTCWLLYPPPDFLSRRAVERWRSTNNNSVVVQLAFGRHSFLFPGDIMHPAEAELVRSAGAALRSTVLVAPHHGSRTSSSEEFLAAVAPCWVIVSARDNGKRRHPHAEVIERYLRCGSRIYSTEQHGAIRIRTDGRNLSIEPFVRD